MSVFEAMANEGDHEQVVFCEDKRIGFRAIIAIHDTTLGPALGGCRMWHYESEEEALTDVLRLSKGMTYKASAAGLNLGGGKAVIIGHRKDKSEAAFRVFGRFVEALNGRYITAEDVGTTVHDMEFIFMETKYVTGVAPAHGGSGDPSPVTAFGVYQGMKAAAKHAFGDESIGGKRIAVQGIGNVGANLVRHLVENGAQVTITDIDAERCKQLQAQHSKIEIVSPEEIYDVDCDIFSPNALGAVINDETIPRLKCDVVCGGANNQLAEDRHGRILGEKGMLYAPDYVVNAGGLINVYVEMEGYVRERALRMAEGIYANTERVLNISRDQGIPTFEAADRFAEERIENIGQIKKGFFGGI